MNTAFQLNGANIDQTITSNYYKSPMALPIIFQGIYDFSVDIGRNTQIPYFEAYNVGNQELKITNSTGNVIYQETVELNGNLNLIHTINDKGIIIVEDLGSTISPPYATYLIPARAISLTSDTYTVYYRFYVDSVMGYYTATGSMGIVENRLPLKKWTITDVIVRSCDLIEPLRYGQKPRFRLDGVIYDDTTGNATGYQSGSIAEELDKIIAPEYAFTKMTFREQMQQVGGYIHAEFRITGITPKSDNDRRYFTFTFDKYGSNRRAVIKDLKRPVSATFKTDINEYCTALDSSAENVINQLDWAQGVIVEPFNKADISLRTESTTVRMEEDNNTFIPTTYPLYQAGAEFKVICTYIAPLGTGEWDITPYIFEKADYDLLSSYTGTYPYCKAYGLYYTQGERHIKGLFFKAEHAVSSIFNKNAIVNILRAVTGNNNLNLDYDQLMMLSFRIEYKPVYSERIQTNKQCVIGGIPRTLAYNQTANLIEARHYGEHLKGIVARLGNVEKTLTYYLAFLSDIPRIGTLYDDNYYISAVYCEHLEPYIKCTIALSKDFNRLSQYIGINSEKRMWEVSEKMAQKRESVIPEYAMISENPIGTDDNARFYYPAKRLFNKTIFAGETLKPVSAAGVFRKNKDYETDANDNDITLPVIGSAMGNSMLFTFKFEDNYSAGQKTIPVTDYDSQGDPVDRDHSKITGRWANFVPYCDYYGRFWWLGFNLRSGDVSFRVGYSAADVPNVEVYGATPLIALYVKYRKDSREVPQITYCLSAVTDNPQYIIGSALMRNCSLVNKSPKPFKLYVFKNRLNTIISKVPFDEMIAGVDYLLLDINSVNFNNQYLDFSAVSTDFEYSAWAITTEMTSETIRVEDEDGNELTQTIYSGGEIVIGKNGTLPSRLYMQTLTDVYD